MLINSLCHLILPTQWSFMLRAVPHCTRLKKHIFLTSIVSLPTYANFLAIPSISIMSLRVFISRRREHITPVLRRLHWLSVRQRVIFKLATLVYRSLAGTAPAYLSDECHLTSSVGVRSLWSADSRTCVPRRAHSADGVRYFATASSSLCNSLLLQFRKPDISFNRLKLYWRCFCFMWRRSRQSATNR